MATNTKSVVHALVESSPLLSDELKVRLLKDIETLTEEGLTALQKALQSEGELTRTMMKDAVRHALRRNDTKSLEALDQALASITHDSSKEDEASDRNQEGEQAEHLFDTQR